MRLLCIFVLLCVSIGTVSPFSWGDIKLPPWIPSFFGNALDKSINKICLYLKAHPDRAATLFSKLNDTLQQTEETRNTFVLTINYINTPDKLMMLTNSTDTCTTFFNDIYNSLVNDLKNKSNNIDLNDAKQKALGVLKSWCDTFH